MLAENLFDFNDDKNVLHQAEVYDKYSGFYLVSTDMPIYVGTISAKLQDSMIVNKSINELFNSTLIDKQLCTFGLNKNFFKQR